MFSNTSSLTSSASDSIVTSKASGNLFTTPAKSKNTLEFSKINDTLSNNTSGFGTATSSATTGSVFGSITGIRSVFPGPLVKDDGLKSTMGFGTVTPSVTTGDVQFGSATGLGTATSSATTRGSFGSVTKLETATSSATSRDLGFGPATEFGSPFPGAPPRYSTNLFDKPCSSNFVNNSHWNQTTIEIPESIQKSGFSRNPFTLPQVKDRFGIPHFEKPRHLTTMEQDLNTWCHTDTIVKKDSFMWTISNFKFRSETRGKCIKSSIFQSGSGSECEHRWRLDIYPNGYSDSLTDNIPLKINLLDEEQQGDVRVHIEISILNINKNIVRSLGKNTMTITLPETGVIYCNDFLNKQELINNADYMLPSGALSILFEVGTMTGTTTKSQKKKHYCASKDIERQSMYEYFQAGKFCDVVLEVDGTELKTHKMILSMKSPVFAAIFDKELTSDESKNHIVIEDMKLDVVKKMLEFIYTGKILIFKQSKVYELTIDLLVAAQKYQIDGLKLTCEELLFDIISIENATKILTIVHKHDMEGLKELVIDFIKDHACILRSSEFKELEKDFPSLSMQVFRAIAIDRIEN